MATKGNGIRPFVQVLKSGRSDFYPTTHELRTASPGRWAPVAPGGPRRSTRLGAIVLVRWGGLSQYARMKILAGVARSLSNLFNRKQRDLNRSRLVTLYMNQANGRDGASSEFSQTRQRRNGKFQTNRERA